MDLKFNERIFTLTTNNDGTNKHPTASYFSASLRIIKRYHRIATAAKNTYRYR